MLDNLEHHAVEQLNKRLNYIEAGGMVQRMHTIPTIHSQNVAAHSFGVAWWVWLLSRSNQPSVNLLMAALQHDLPEQALGDIPSPAKRRLGLGASFEVFEQEVNAMAELPLFEHLISEDERRVLKLADTLELCQHCIRERSLGNKTAKLVEMWCNIIRYAGDVVKTQFEAKALELLTLKWNEA